MRCIKRWCAAGPAKISTLTKMLMLKNKKELQAILGIINYFSIFSPDTLEVCEPLRKLMSSKAMWTWDASYQQWFEKAKSLIKAEMCMKCYDDTKPLYLKTEHLELALGQHYYNWGKTHNLPNTHDTRQHNPLPYHICKQSLMHTECRYSNIECEALGILHGLEKFHHYCFGREVLVITHHKLLVSMSKKRCGHIITTHTVHTIKNPPIQGPDHIQTWPSDFYCRWAVET